MVVLKAASKGKVRAEDIIEWCKGHMAAYKCPRMVEFVDALPKSATGKVMWRALQEQESAADGVEGMIRAPMSFVNIRR